MKASRVKTLVLLLCCLVTIPVWSQDSDYYIDSDAPPFKPEYFVVGMRFGGVASTLRGMNGISLPGYEKGVPAYKTRPLLDFSYGFIGQVMFHNQLLVQLDLSMTGVGASLKYPEEDDSQWVRDYHFQTRLLFGSKKVWAEIGDQKLVFLYGFGPYMGISMGSSDGTLEDPFTSDGDFHMGKMDLHKVDLGLSAMAGIETSILQVSLHYDHGFRNLARSGGKYSPRDSLLVWDLSLTFRCS